MSKDRAFVRYTKQGEIVPGSLIISKTWPNGPGIWYEVDMILPPTTQPPLITTTTTTPPGPEPPVPVPGLLNLRFNSISLGNTGVLDPYDVNEWNIFFDLPNYGQPFTSVIIQGDQDVFLQTNIINNNNISIKDDLYKNNTNLIEVIDQNCFLGVGNNSFENCTNLTNFTSNTCIGLGDAAFYQTTNLNIASLPLVGILQNEVFYGSGLQSITFSNVVNCGNNCFQAMPNLTSIDLPVLSTAGDYAFADNATLNSINLPELNTAGAGFMSNNPSISTLDLPMLTQCGASSFADNVSLYYLNIPLVNDLGGSCGDNSVFSGITGQTIDIYISFGVNTCNGGLPDDDIQWLQANNTVTLNVVI